jgi:hypothetical protein
MQQVLLISNEELVPLIRSRMDELPNQQLPPEPKEDPVFNSREAADYLHLTVTGVLKARRRQQWRGSLLNEKE